MTNQNSLLLLQLLVLLQVRFDLPGQPLVLAQLSSRVIWGRKWVEVKVFI